MNFSLFFFRTGSPPMQKLFFHHFISQLPHELTRPSYPLMWYRECANRFTCPGVLWPDCLRKPLSTEIMSLPIWLTISLVSQSRKFVPLCSFSLPLFSVFTKSGCSSILCLSVTLVMALRYKTDRGRKGLVDGGLVGFL